MRPVPPALVLALVACAADPAPSDLPCTDDASCPDGEVCWRWFERGGDPPRECPRFAPPPKEGERCAFSSDQGDGSILFAVACAADLECATPDDFGADTVGACVVPRGVGETCGAADAARDGCADGLVCAREDEAVDGECVQP